MMSLQEYADYLKSLQAVREPETLIRYKKEMPVARLKKKTFTMKTKPHATKRF